VHARGVGPAPIPVGEFTLERLVDAIRFMLNPEVMCDESSKCCECSISMYNVFPPCSRCTNIWHYKIAHAYLASFIS
jgi:hypothetical protein